MLLAAALVSVGWAADDEDPGRGVARVSLVSGGVSVRCGDSADSVAAAVKAPLVVGDQLLTGSGSRAELQFDWANVVRLSSNAEIHLAELESNRYMLQLARGTSGNDRSLDVNSGPSLDSPDAGIIRGTNSLPRQMQFGLRLIW